MNWYPTVVDEAVVMLVELVQQWGWYVVFVVVALYFLQPTLEKWRQQRSLASANDPQRMQMLDAERDRARARQAVAAVKARGAKQQEGESNKSD